MLPSDSGQAPKRGRTTSGETASALGCAAQRTRPTRSGTRFLPEASCPAGGELLNSWTRWGLAEVLALDATELDQWLVAVADLYPVPPRTKTS